DLVSASGKVKGMAWPPPLTPLFSMAVHAANRGDEVKMSGALAKIMEEDPSISHEHNPDTGEMLLWGQGEMHLLITLDRMKGKFHIDVDSERPQVPYKETIRKPTSQHARHKKQSGGHGEFGDVHLDIRPLARGEGFTFGDTITGGVVPKQYIPAVEAGVREYLVRGPLGFPVVDLSVTLTDGQYHNVDSSDMAFRKAAQQAMREGMPNCQPVLLEPICKVVISMPSEFTSRMQRLVSGRRGQIMGFDAKPGWAGWDEVQVQLPQSEMHDLVIELRSMTMGVGTFEWEFDHLQELMGKEADQVVALRAQAAQ
ncbi:MAG: elongation factor G, partial [Alphaproteobacteria bacterium]